MKPNFRLSAGALAIAAALAVGASADAPHIHAITGARMVPVSGAAVPSDTEVPPLDVGVCVDLVCGALPPHAAPLSQPLAPVAPAPGASGARTVPAVARCDVPVGVAKAPGRPPGPSGWPVDGAAPPRPRPGPPPAAGG